MAKKSIYRVIGIIFAKNKDMVISTITPYLLDYKQIVISPLKQDLRRKSPKYLRLQIDFYNHVIATKCHEAVSDLFLEDKSNI